MKRRKKVFKEIKIPKPNGKIRKQEITKDSIQMKLIEKREYIEVI